MKLLQRLKNLFLPEGQISDGFHTFDELYHYRMLYNAAFFNSLEGKYEVHKSYRHADGELCFGGGWFIVMANLPTGQVSNLEHETNGWDLDYWATFVKGNLTYSISGSHYYGNCVVEKEL